MTKIEEIMQAIEEMTILELNDLVKAMEEKFGVVQLRLLLAWLCLLRAALLLLTSRLSLTLFWLLPAIRK